jgi:large subunit ribosomal protein L25
MSNEFELNVSVRTDTGKGSSRRLRRLNDNIPAVLYGGGKNPVSLTIAHKDIAKAIENEAFFSHIITLNVDNKKEQAVIKDLQRHPAKSVVLHADFLRVSDKQAINVKVPIHFLNEEKCVGVKLGGGNILKTLNEIEISCLPKDLPAYLEVDMLEIDLGESIHLSDIALPEGVTSIALSHGEDNDLSVATVAVPKAEEEEEVVDEAAEDVEEGADDDAGSADAGSEDKSGDNE